MKQFVSITSCLCVRFFYTIGMCISVIARRHLPLYKCTCISNDYFVSCLANNNTILDTQTFVVILFIYTRQLFTFSVLQIYFCLIVYCLYRIMIHVLLTCWRGVGGVGEGVGVEVGVGVNCYQRLTERSPD